MRPYVQQRDCLGLYKEEIIDYNYITQSYGTEEG